MKDSWQSGNPYEYFMGRWSKLVANGFVDWLSPVSQKRWLDVGCGSGALSEAIINKCAPEIVIAVDQSEGFVQTAQKRLGDAAICKVGDAYALPVEDGYIDATVSGLVLNFLPEPEKALLEMRRVTRKGGIVAVYVWDYAGKMEFLNHFWDVVVELNPKASELHEKRRFADFNGELLSSLFTRAGFTNIETAPVEITTGFTDFDDYWHPFLGGQGPAPTYVSKMSDPEKEQLRESLENRIPVTKNGSILLSARAWAVKGTH